VVRETVTAQRKTLEGQATVCARLRPDTARLDDPAQAARFALRGVAQRIVALRREIAAYDTHLDALIADILSPLNLKSRAEAAAHAVRRSIAHRS